MKRRKSLRFLILGLCLAVLTSAAACSSKPDGQSTSDETSVIVGTVSDLEASIDYNSAKTITLSGDSASAQDGCALVSGSSVTVSSGGTYILTGTLNDGQIIVNADKQDVRLVLDNADICCKDSSPILIQDAKNTYIILRTGSKNSLSDTKDYITDDSGDPDATLYCKNDLVIGGNGSLDITSAYSCAVHTKDSLTVCGGAVTINAADSGIKAKDGLTVSSGSLWLKSTNDGLKTTNSEDSSLGNILISGGSLNITSGTDCIQCENSLTVSGGQMELNSGGGAADAPKSMQWGTASVDGDSAKGLKATNDIIISGGEVSCNCADDAIHSNGDVTVSGGKLELKTGDDGIHADGKLAVNGGNIVVSQSYEGLEAAVIDISGGSIELTASDDGLNAAGGSDSSGTAGFGGNDPFSGSADYDITISDGYLYVNSGGDGIDSNGTITVSGGTVVVSGPTDNGNSAIDYGIGCTINGGFVIAAGSSGMAETVSDSSAQNTISYSIGSSQNAGTLSCIRAADGTVIAAFAPEKSYDYILVSSADITTGTEYTLTTGGSCSGTETHGLYSGTDCSGGSEAATVTVSSAFTSYGSSSFGGGPGGFGGNPGNFGGGPGAR